MGADGSTILVDGGEEPWPRLEQVLSRRRTELTPGASLSIMARHPDVEEPLRSWCHSHGLLLSHHPDGPPTLFLVRSTADTPLEDA